MDIWSRVATLQSCHWQGSVLTANQRYRADKWAIKLVQLMNPWDPVHFQKTKIALLGWELLGLHKTYQTKANKPNRTKLPNKPSTPILTNKTYQTKPTKNLTNQANQSNLTIETYPTYILNKTPQRSTKNMYLTSSILNSSGCQTR